MLIFCKYHIVLFLVFKSVTDCLFLNRSILHQYTKSIHSFFQIWKWQYPFQESIKTTYCQIRKTMKINMYLSFNIPKHSVTWNQNIIFKYYINKYYVLAIQFKNYLYAFTSQREANDTKRTLKNSNNRKTKMTRPKH